MAHENDWVTVEDTAPYRLGFPETNESEEHIDYTTKWVANDESSGEREFVSEPLKGLSILYGVDIWHDGDKTYFSYGNSHYVLDKTTNTWLPQTWINRPYFYRDRVWTDGTDIYNTNGKNQQYILDRETSTWVPISWGDISIGLGENIWHDNNGNTYYSFTDKYTNKQYVYDKENSAWLPKTWTGIPQFVGKYVWHDNGNIYYSHGSEQYILDESTSTWNPKTWVGLTSFDNTYIWTDGVDVFYSNTTQQYKLNRETSTWEPYTWVGIRNPNGANMWNNDGVIRYSAGSLNKVLKDVMVSSTPYRLDFPLLKDSKDAKHDWYIDDDIPFQGGFPPLKESIKISRWFIDDDIPFKLDFPELLESSTPPKPIFWLQYAGYVPYRPWPGKIQIPNIVDTVEIPEIDWTKSMQQTFEYFTVDPKTWYDDKQLFQIISSNHSIDLTSDLRGSATISTNELLGENYIRTYMVCKQGRYTHRVCLGTYLYMTSDDSFNGIVHTYTMTGYTPLVELQESMPPIGFFIYGQVKKGDEAPLITDEIKKAILENTRCELEMNVTIPKPLLNNFVAGTDDNWLTVVNNLLSASNEARYMLTVDEWGTLQLKNSPIVSNMQPTFVYDDSNSSILLPEVNTGDDLFQIPNTVELIFVGNTRFIPCRKIVKNEDEASPVSVQNRGREIVKRYTISNIAIPASSNPTQEMIEEMIENQAYTLLETASTIQKTISYSHGYCGTKVGDCVMINYERAGLSNVKAVITSQKINCTPGCQVDETASYTKKYFKRN